MKILFSRAQTVHLLGGCCEMRWLTSYSPDGEEEEEEEDDDDDDDDEDEDDGMEQVEVIWAMQDQIILSPSSSAAAAATAGFGFGIWEDYECLRYSTNHQSLKAYILSPDESTAQFLSTLQGYDDNLQ
ncbi:hypothetical protein T310_3246 [Rasamsonia emersonii CBS 393.64]|uniref:Uncharacterized protein n=1 Tax=Rasamsonia emersonii (strain ATCC 16479 / CBS 393.64 / IMI 116815) TaxID=1408163 RepID=A0A0F4YYL0_RASE3|nr:hypothetical protein T310_3246 [Rasamsonia emersonii CBS 393.64]KKA22703.1 hypothetical protein T310_3246 [Rasamsonia emersonii CBS 393.64]